MISGLTYTRSHNRLYWINREEQTIYSYDIETTNIDFVEVAHGPPESITFDQNSVYVSIKSEIEKHIILKVCVKINI